MPRSLVLLSLVSACGFGQATLVATISGEMFIQRGIPAEEFADGWEVRFDKFLISVGELEVASTSERGSLSVPGFQVFDLTDAWGHMAQDSVPQGFYDETRFVVAPAADAVAGSASAADLKIMQDGGYSVYVVGEASKEETTVRFAWGFTTHTRYEACEPSAEVRKGMADGPEITIHGDHLFYDDLVSETPAVRFDLIASADADGDGEVTQAELTAVDLRPLANYQVGSTGIVDLWHFIEQQTTTLGHIDGEGHCDAVRES